MAVSISPHTGSPHLAFSSNFDLRRISLIISALVAYSSPGAPTANSGNPVLRPHPAHRQGIQRKARTPSPQPGEGRLGQPPRRWAVKLQRIRRPERRRTKRTLRFGRRPRENAHRPPRTNLIAASRGRKDADHKSGGPRYPVFQIAGSHGERISG